MYANLCVSVGGEHLEAYEVSITAAEIVVMLDKQDGTGSYAEPAGQRRFPIGTALVITADF